VNTGVRYRRLCPTPASRYRDCAVPAMSGQYSAMRRMCPGRPASALVWECRALHWLAARIWAISPSTRENPTARPRPTIRWLAPPLRSLHFLEGPAVDSGLLGRTDDHQGDSRRPRNRRKPFSFRCRRQLSIPSWWRQLDGVPVQHRALPPIADAVQRQIKNSGRLRQSALGPDIVP